ncbi:MAG: hypothetical protein RJB01_1552, partial [Actinomycetota bacterium]
CAARVEKKLNRLPGVHASVNFATERALIQLPAELSISDAIATVEATGYTAQEFQREKRQSRDTAAIRNRLIVSAILTVPVVLISMIHVLHFPGWEVVALVLTTPVVTWGAWPFHRAAAINARHRTTTMDTLIALGVSAAYLWSIAALFIGGDLYFEVAAAVTTFLLLGRYWEYEAKDRSAAALENLARGGASEAQRITPNGIETVDVNLVHVGDLCRVLPGQKVPADGVVRYGAAAVDTSAITGESQPLRAVPGTQVIGAALVLDGSLDIEITAVGENTQIAKALKLLEQAQAEKAPAQRLADRISAVFVPIVIVIALLTLMGWLLAGAAVGTAIAIAVTVLIIACPCALGLATPTALLVGTGRGAQLGILIRGPRVLESTRAITLMALDKTGTLTEGKMAITGIFPTGEVTEDQLLGYAAAVESRSEHPIAAAVVAAVDQPEEIDHFIAVPGEGVSGKLGESTVLVGRLSWIAQTGVDVPDLMESAAVTRIGVARDGTWCGYIELSDQVRADAAFAITVLRALNIDPVMITGDGPEPAWQVANAVGITTVISEARPVTKLEFIRDHSAQGQVVAMVGDGVNDAAALAVADLGIAMGSGTDIAQESADIIIMRPGISAVVDAVRLSRKTLRIIKGNLFWAFAYNVAAIPLAVAGLLNPMIAGAAMAFSSIFVVTNSLRLRRFTPLH